MAGINNIKMKPKLISAFLLAGIIPLVIVAFMSMNKANDGMFQLAENQLESVQKIKAGQIQTFFNERVGDAEVFAQMPFVSLAIAELDELSEVAKKQGYSGRRLLDHPEYKKAYDYYIGFIQNYMDTYGYFDVFLLSPNSGRVLLSVALEADFGTELRSENHTLAKSWQKMNNAKQVVLSDMEPYTPSKGAPAMFVVAPSYSEGKYVGSIGLQISNEAINRIMQERSGMGETGETYLVGSDKKMRSDSFLDPTGHSIAASFKGTVQNNGVDTKAANDGIAGRSGIEIILDYNGNPVLSAYSPLELHSGINWVCIAEIDQAEIEKPVDEMRTSSLFIGIIIALIVSVFALWMATSIAKPIIKVTEVSQAIADGDLSVEVDIDQTDEVGQLVDAFRNMRSALKNKAEMAVQIANGNLDVDVKVASEADVLGKAMETMKESLIKMRDNLQNTIEEQKAGDIDSRCNPDGFQGAYAELLSGVNEALESVIEPIVESIGMMQEYAEGDLSKEMRELPGKQIVLTEGLRGIRNGMISVADTAGKIAQGDLTVSVESRSEKDTLMIAMKGMVENLTKVVQDVQSAADNVASGSQELSSSAQNMAQGATEQAASAEEASASMEQMTANIQQNSDNAQQTEQIGIKAAEDAKKSGEAVKQAVAAMSEIGEKISIIEEIARQTNMLALNAAIEAARAGEQGKGFAVVAAEVRKLAERSQKAAGEITELTQSNTEIAKNAGEMLEKLVPDIQKTAELVQEINAASNEQRSGSEQVNKAIQQLDQVIQQNASATEQMSATSEELSAQSEQLKDTVGFFKINGNGRTIHSNAAARTAKPVKHQVQAAQPVKRKVAAAKSTKKTLVTDDGILINMNEQNGNGDAIDKEFEKF